MVVHSIPRRTIDARDGGRETRRRKSSHLMCKRLRGETKRGEDKQRKLCPGENQGVARPPPPPSHYVEASRPVGDNGVAGERRPNGITELLHGRTGTDVGCARGHGALLCGGPRVRACVCLSLPLVVLIPSLFQRRKQGIAENHHSCAFRNH